MTPSDQVHRKGIYGFERRRQEKGEKKQGNHQFPVLVTAVTAPQVEPEGREFDRGRSRHEYECMGHEGDENMCMTTTA
jgi:hypothetical protein